MLEFLRTAWTKIKGLRAYLDYFEPARLRATYAAVIALLAIWGLSIPAKWDEEITGALSFLAIALPIVQSWLTRGAVFSPATHNAQVEAAYVQEPPPVLPAAGEAPPPDGDEEVPDTSGRAPDEIVPWDTVDPADRTEPPGTTEPPADPVDEPAPGQVEDGQP